MGNVVVYFIKSIEMVEDEEYKNRLLKYMLLNIIRVSTPYISTEKYDYILKDRDLGRRYSRFIHKHFRLFEHYEKAVIDMQDRLLQKGIDYFIVDKITCKKSFIALEIKY